MRPPLAPMLARLAGDGDLCADVLEIEQTLPL